MINEYLIDDSDKNIEKKENKNEEKTICKIQQKK